MIDFRTATLADVLDAFASPDPAPGGGSAAALAGALGVSLLVMVASIGKTRTGAAAETVDLSAAAARLRPLRDHLTSLVDEDGRAYLNVLAAYRQPKQTEADQVARRDAIQLAMRAAIEIPLQTMRECEQALREAAVVVKFGNRNAVADAVVGVRLLLAAVESAGMNVDVNLPGVSDAGYVERSRQERQSLLSSGAQLANQAFAVQ